MLNAYAMYDKYIYLFTLKKSFYIHKNIKKRHKSLIKNWSLNADKRFAAKNQKFTIWLSISRSKHFPDIFKTIHGTIATFTVADEIEIILNDNRIMFCRDVNRQLSNEYKRE